MKKKLNSILLIDDDEATNYIHQIIIKDHGLCDNIVFKLDGEDALDYLSSPEGEGLPNPDIIFLDINMPGLDGWGFLEKYQEFCKEKPSKIIVMLTTSLNKYDKEKAESMDIISEFRNKPLSGEVLDEIVEKYFVNKPDKKTL